MLFQQLFSGEHIEKGLESKNCPGHRMVVSKSFVGLVHVILNSLMQYVLCPRCQFKVPVNKHLCSTCGFVMPVVHPGEQTSGRSTVVISPNKQGFWATLFGVQEPASEDNEPDQAAVN